MNNIYYEGSTVYVSGTHHISDIGADALIPINRLNESHRYRQFEEWMDLHKHLNLKYGVGHSLGGSLILEYAKRHPEKKLKTFTYGAPVWSSRIELPDISRNRTEYDPISFFDWSAQTDPLLHWYINPHGMHTNLMKPRTL